eukprot:CAMPEP_0194078748 /NCGR_PEP_ID=MMETSP0149-20130528/5068_1 /TAXON_ID=122233 /ORGANISM="Chaetoceros debilis, Strain MM31A-1" /LENGTH=442 /DNA_ID=CAMNT_0038760063 /DNA_START=28 /DNA_END=1356 /DNA_ORIENTATION=+
MALSNMKYLAVSALLLISRHASATPSSSGLEVALPPPVVMDPGASTGGGGGGNPIGQLTGYVKDSFLRMKDGSVQLYSNHKRCNEIRTKQKDHLAAIAATFPPNSPEQKAASKYRNNAGGVSYEEYNFLVKGKDDRSKLANIVFMMFFQPNFVPYAFMFFPDMLPSPFAMPKKQAMPFSKFENISRERTHAVLQTMIDLEKSSRVPSMLSNMNPFGKGKTRRSMEKLDLLGRQAGGLLVANDANGTKGAELVLKVLKDEIYTDVKPKNNNLGDLPKPLVKGLGRALEAPSFNSLLPGFFVRGKIVNNLKQIEMADEFLVKENVDLNSLSSLLLEETCSARLIGGPGRSNNDMVEGLEAWLDLSVRQPKEIVKESGKHCNANLLRTALLSYNALDGARDGRSASYLPRLLFQGQSYSSNNESAQIEGKDAFNTGRKWKKIINK